MKLVCMFVLITLSGGLSAQVVFGNPMFRVLYYGYENTVDIGTNDGREFELKSDNIRIKKSTNGYVFIPDSRENAQLYFIDPNKGECFDTIQFEVRVLPAPDLYFGSAASGEKAKIFENVIYARYNESIPLIARFKVLDFSLAIGSGKVITVSGNQLGDELIQKLKSLEPDTLFTIVATVEGPDGLKRKIKGSWTR